MKSRQGATATAEKPTELGSRAEKTAANARSTTIGGGAGWDAYEKVASETKKNYASEGRFTPAADEEYLIAFREDKPYFVYPQHWINNRSKGKKRSFTCANGDDSLCDLGVETRMVTLFNVFVVDGAAHEPLWWPVSRQNSERIRQLAENKATKPLNKEGQYFVIKRVEKDNGFWETTFDRMLSAELDEAERLTADDLAAPLWTAEETVEKVNHEQMNEAADEVIRRETSGA